MPRIGTTTGWSQSRHSELGSVTVSELLERVELVDVVARHDDGDFERAEPGIGEVIHRPACGVVRADAADRIVSDRIGSIEADLDVEVIHRGETTRLVGIDEGTVGRELDPDVAADRVVDQLEEIATDHWFAATDIDVENLQVVELVQHPFGFDRCQLAGVAAARR